MKIAMVFDGIGYGGITTVGLDYIKIFLKAGWSVDVYNLTGSIAREKDIPEECKIYHDKLSAYFCPQKYSGGVKRYPWGRFVYPVLYIILTAFIAVKRILRFNKKDYDVAIAFSGHWTDLTYVSKGFINAKYKIAWLHGALYQYLLMSEGYLSLYRNIGNLVVLITAIQEEALVYNSFARLNIKQMYNPTMILERTVNFEKVQELKNKYGDFWIMVALLMQPKDHATVLQAIKILKDKYNCENKLLLLGNGPNKNVIEHEIRKMGLEEQVILLGAVDDVENYYTSCFALVHASLFEGFGMVLVEALSFNKPVVCTDCGAGVREVLMDGEYGILCKIQDPEDLARCMKMLIDDKELYKDLSRKAAFRAKAFGPNAISTQVEELLENLKQ